MADIEAPLLSKNKDSPTTSNHSFHDGGFNSALHAAHSAHSRGPRLTFFDRYEAVGGVPARIIKPSPEAWNMFTRHTFSADGSRLATGEANGTIRVWNTSNYSLVAEAQRLFKNGGVSCLSFVSQSNDVLIAADFANRVAKFEFRAAETREGPSADASRKEAVIIRDVKLFYGGTYSWYMFSEDGTRLICYDYKPSPVVLHVYKFTNDGYQRCFLETDHKRAILALAENGKSVLACCFNATESTFDHHKCVVRVWPELDFECRQQRVILLNGDRALWGLKGEYLMLWNSFSHRPRLSVFKTKDLCNSSSSPSTPLAIRFLEAELANWKALMLDRQNRDRGPHVLIEEAGKSGKRRFLIWDTEQNTIINEADVTMHLKRSIDMTKWRWGGKTAKEIVDHDLPANTWPIHDYCIVADQSPKFGASADMEWIAAFSWRKHSCAISSMKSGATIWNCVIPEEIEMHPFRRLRALFDPSGRHFTIMGSGAIITWAPSFLYPKNAWQVKNFVFPEGNPLDAIANQESLRAVFNTLPRRALGQAATLRIRSGATDMGLGTWLRERLDVGCLEVELSADCLQTAIIAMPYNNVAYTYPKRYHPKLFAHTFEAKRSCSTLTYKGTEARLFRLRHGGHRPARVFLYNTGDDDDEKKGMALFGVKGSNVVFCDLASKTSKMVNLQLAACNVLSQTANRDQLVTLDTHSVCVFDLREQEIVKRIRYLANISELFQMARQRRQWPYEQRFSGDLDPNRRISHAGDAVLLGWDTKNRRSIVLSPDTVQSACEDLIDAAENSLSDFCVFDRDARCTLFIDVDELRNNKLTVGIFDESTKRVTYHVQVVHNLHTSGMSEVALRMLASCVFYDLSPDGSELVTYVAPKDERELPTEDLEERIQVFSLYGTTDCLPSYKRLKSCKRSIAKQSVDEVFALSGSCAVFNMPTSEGTSILQEAFLKNDHEMVECIEQLAGRNECELACDWTSPEGISCNLLKEGFHMKSPNEVKRAVRLLGSVLTPFVKAANAMKDCFKDLLTGHPKVIEDALTSNALAVKACQFKVPVDFIDAKLRKNTAVHIDTTDTIAEWMHNNDPDSLEQIWRSRNADAVEQMEKNGNKSTAEACLKYVCIEDAAKVGMNGILRPLLFKRMPEMVFNTDVVRWIIMYKWHKIWKPRFIKTAISYGVFLFFFTVYAVFVAATAQTPGRPVWKFHVSTAILPVLFGFGLSMLKEEVVQIMTFMKDGREHFKTRRWGIAYFFNSRWNWIDLSSCFLLLILIPLFHMLALFSSGFNDLLSAVIAIEAVLASSKVWYFAQPFRRTGALVLLIDNVVRDCIAFLGLAFVVLFGFALALHVLFRGVPDEMDEGKQLNKSELQDDDYHPFGTFHDSLLTLFYAMLGDFESSIFRVGGWLSWLIILTFVAYMAAEMIVLLNLLIAIMGDTFDRVKSTEEGQLLLARAHFIDACEGALNEAEKNEMKYVPNQHVPISLDLSVSHSNNIGKYVQVLVSLEDKHATSDWPGRLRMFGRTVSVFQVMYVYRSSVNESEERVKEAVDERLKALEERMDEKLSAKMETAACITKELKLLDEKVSKNAENMEKFETEMSENVQAAEEKMIENMQQVEARLVEKVEALNQTVTDEVNALRMQVNQSMSTSESISQMESQIEKILSLLQNKRDP